MNAGELIQLYRTEANDTKAPYFVSDKTLLQFASEAEREACRRSDLLVDSTADFCSVSVSANEPLVKIDPRITKIRRARLSISVYPLTPVRSGEMDRTSPGWESHVGTPTTYVTDYQTGHIRLYPNIRVNADLIMTVARLPLTDMSSVSDEPEIREELHPALVKWMLYRAYSITDAELFDPAKSERSLIEFEREFGKKPSGRNEAWMREQPMIESPTIA